LGQERKKVTLLLEELLEVRLTEVSTTHGSEIAQFENALTMLTFEAGLVEGLSVGIHPFHSIDSLAAEVAAHILTPDETHSVCCMRRG